MVIVARGEGGGLRAARITNRRWALSALGAAAACTLTSADTVYCCLPLHHPAGLLVSVGGAVVGGSRLALAPRFEPSVFWTEVQAYGATVVFYAGEMGRELLRAPATPAERGSPLRLFAGSGMRADAWRRLTARTGVGVLEFYASTEGALVLANAAGDKVGALGRPLPGSSEVALLTYDFARGEIARDALGRGRRAADGEPGVLAARLGSRPSASSPPCHRVARGVFEAGDAWLTTGDLARRDRGRRLLVRGPPRRRDPHERRPGAEPPPGGHPLRAARGGARRRLRRPRRGDPCRGARRRRGPAPRRPARRRRPLRRARRPSPGRGAARGACAWSPPSP